MKTHKKCNNNIFCYHFACHILSGAFHSAGCGGDPTPPVNGSIVWFVSAVVGSQTLYSCDPGFFPEGLRISICSPNMSWSPNPADYTCRKPCKLYVAMHTTQGLICFLCIDTSSVPVFAPPALATCNDPPPPFKGSIGGYTSTVEGSVVTFYCNEGLTPEGQMNTTCASNGSWTPNPADLICNEPPSDCEGQLSVELYLTTL